MGRLALGDACKCDPFVGTYVPFSQEKGCLALVDADLIAIFLGKGAPNPKGRVQTRYKYGDLREYESQSWHTEEEARNEEEAPNVEKLNLEEAPHKQQLVLAFYSDVGTYKFYQIIPQPKEDVWDMIVICGILRRKYQNKEKSLWLSILILALSTII
ncbi:hypothetical protein ACFE04_028105 [Oxalis oulophora]